MIHQKLGTGSLTTITRHKRAIEQARRETEGEGLPDPVLATLHESAESIWTQLSEAADARIGLVDKESRQRVIEAEKLAEDSRSALTTAQHQLSEARERIRNMEQKLDSQVQEASTLRQALSAVRERSSAQEERILAREGLIEELRIQLGTGSDQISQLTERLEAGENTRLQLRRSIDESREKMQALANQNALELESLRKAYSDAKSTTRSIRAERDQLETLQKETLSRHDVLMDRIDELQQENASLMQRIGSLQGEKASLESRISDIRRELAQDADSKQSELIKRLEKLKASMNRKNEDRQ